MIDEQISFSEHSNEEMPHPNIMSVMVTDMDTSEDRTTELEKKISMLIKGIRERDYEIASLKNHIKSCDATKLSHTHSIKNTNKGKAVMQESQPQNFDFNCIVVCSTVVEDDCKLHQNLIWWTCSKSLFEFQDIY